MTSKNKIFRIQYDVKNRNFDIMIKNGSRILTSKWHGDVKTEILTSKLKIMIKLETKRRKYSKFCLNILLLLFYEWCTFEYNK